MYKYGILGFWAMWYSVVTISNLVDAGQATGLLAPGWPLASGNYALVVSTVAPYHPAAWMPGVLFGAAILFELVSAVLFWRAWYGAGRPWGLSAARVAFAVGLLGWGGFQLVDEVCVAYALGGKHMLIALWHGVSCLLVLAEAPQGSTVQPRQIG